MVKEVVTVDLGGTNLRVGLVQGGKILKYIKKKTPKTGKELVDMLFENIESVMNSNVVGIGVSSAGPLKDGVIKNPPNLPLKNFDLKGVLRKKFRKRVEVENDAACVAISEAKFGCKKKNFIILTLGTGIGGGVIIDGKLYKGEGYGGELGHIILNDGKDFEELWKLNRAKRKGMLLKDLVKMKGGRAKRLVDEVADYIGQGIASLISVFDPEVVILAGGVRECGGKMLGMIKRKVRRYSFLPKVTPIEWSRLDHPGTLGASLLID